MARLARVVVPGLPHHVTQKGNRRETVFFAGLLEAAADEAAILAIRRSRTTGRPVGAAEWIKALELATARPLAAANCGPKPRAPTTGQGRLFHTLSP